MGGPQFGAALCGCGLLRAAGCGGARRIAATSEVGDGTAGLCAVLSAAMKYSAVAFFFYTLEASVQVVSDRGLRTC